jgi:hypothetical protein
MRNPKCRTSISKLEGQPGKKGRFLVAQMMVPSMQHVRFPLTEVMSHADECSQGLDQRREKKRLKKAIVTHKYSPKPATEKSNGTVRKNGKKQKSNVAAGLALMHGFTSTNIGGSRLTVCFFPCFELLAESHS